MVMLLRELRPCSSHTTFFFFCIELNFYPVVPRSYGISTKNIEIHQNCFLKRFNAGCLSPRLEK